MISDILVSSSVLTSVFNYFLAPHRCFVSVQQPIAGEERSFPNANGGQHANQRLPHDAQWPLLLRYKCGLSFNSPPSVLLKTFMKDIYTLITTGPSLQMGWWWRPRSTQRPVAWWPKSPRKWFRGVSWEEPLSQRRCFTNLKELMSVNDLLGANMMRNHMSLL